MSLFHCFTVSLRCAAQTKELVQAVWAAKATDDAGRVSPRPLMEFMYTFMTEVHKEHAAVVQSSYNLRLALHRFQDDAELAVFALVLDGRLCADVYRDR